MRLSAAMWRPRQSAAAEAGNGQLGHEELVSKIDSVLAKLDDMDDDSAELSLSALEKEIEDFALSFSPETRKHRYGLPSMLKAHVQRARERRGLCGGFA